MRDPQPGTGVKAWAREYEEAPFFFEHSSEHGERIIAWSEEPEQIKEAFYAILQQLPETVDVLLKICVGKEPEGDPLWSRYHAVLPREHVVNTVTENEPYVFSDGMHQLCVKDPETDRYHAFDDHGIFFLYCPQEGDKEIFRSLGFEERYAEAIYSVPHYHGASTYSEKLETKFVAELGLEKANSDIE